MLEWQSLHYIEKVNRRHDGLRLRKRCKKRETIQEERGKKLPGSIVVNVNVDPGEPGLSGATAIIVLMECKQFKCQLNMLRRLNLRYQKYKALQLSLSLHQVTRTWKPRCLAAFGTLPFSMWFCSNS